MKVVCVAVTKGTSAAGLKLRHGAKLYIGLLDEEALALISEVENYLIDRYPSEMNAKKLPSTELKIEHEGDVPFIIASGR